MNPNPYQAALGERDPVEAMGDTPGRIHALVSRMTDADLARSYAPGKWTAAQLLVHLAQTELALTTRLRMALSQDGYVAQPFDQDRWLVREADTAAAPALGAYIALRQLNQPLFRRLSPADREKTFRHPEHGELTIEWLLQTIAGHELHHLRHFETIAGERGRR
jgi:hypothetical protein